MSELCCVATAVVIKNSGGEGSGRQVMSPWVMHTQGKSQSGVRTRKKFTG
jgi:hypothetical protein